MASSTELTDSMTGTNGGNNLDLTVTDAVAVITIDVRDSKVNTLGSASMNELNALVDKIAADKTIKGLIITSRKSDNFIAGADVGEIRQIQNETAMEAYQASQLGKQVFEKIDRFPFPVVAAINGICLGGGTELVLACDHRLIVTKAKIGLPEVKLGFIPGWGACVRLPKLIGAQKALELIMAGKILSADKAWKVGLVDEVVAEDQLLARARELAGGASPKRFQPDLQQNIMACLLEENPLGQKLLRDMAYKSMMRETKGKYPAPKEALNVVLKSLSLPAAKAYELESSTFAKLAMTPVSRNLVGIFFAQTESKKLPADITEKPAVKTVGVLGAGVMGAGIAQAVANAGYKVILKDVEQRFLDKGKGTIQSLFDKLVERRRLQKADADKIMAEIVFTTDYEDLKDCDLVIEAVIEDLAVKQQALKDLDAVIGKSYTFATNTSSLSVTEIAQASADPSKVVGLHFFNPVHKMPLVEIIRGQQTNNVAIAAAMLVALKLDKTTVIAKDSPGFIVNRILAPYLREAAVLAWHGVPIEDIDRAMKSFGMPMGPLSLLDEIGLDVSAKVIHVMHAFLGERMSEPPLMKDIERLQLLGKKGEKGIYIYANGKQAGVNPDISAAITAKTNKKSAGEIQDRLVLLMLNEAARCIEEQVVTDPAQLDLAMIFGTGFPPFLGGILKYADAAGIADVCKKLELLSRVAGDRYQPCALLAAMAKGRTTFYQVPVREPVASRN